MDDHTEAVCGYPRERGQPGDDVKTSLHRWLMTQFHLSSEQAGHARRQAMRELAAQGRVERVNVRGPYVHIVR